MLTLDCIKEIAYRCNFKSTRKILELYPKLNNSEFWRAKCSLHFPDKIYLDFYTGEENYLLRKVGKFVLAIDFNWRRPCDNFLYEYSRL